MTFARAQVEARATVADSNAAQARASVEAARTNLAQARLALSDTSVRAPFNGVVIARNIDLGALVSNGTIAFTVADIHQVKADFSVPDTALSQLKIGQKQIVFLNTIPVPLTGTITSISPQANQQSRVFVVEVMLPNPDGLIKPGMIGTLALASTNPASPCLVVPLSVLTQAPGGSRFAVYTIQSRGGKSVAVAQPVQIGKTYGNDVEITSGVYEGERVVVLGAQNISDGEAVEVQE